MKLDHPRTFFAADSGAGSGGGEGAGGAGSEDKSAQTQGGEGGQAGDLPDDPEKLKELLKAEREAHKHTVTVHTEMKTKWGKREAEEEKARQEQLKKAGEFERLYGETAPQLETLKATVTKYETALGTYLKAELASVPDNLKALIPEGDAASKLEWIAKAKAAGAFTPGTGGGKGKGADGTPPPGSGGATKPKSEFDKLSPKERAAFIEKGGTVTN